MNCKQANENIILSDLMHALGYEVKKKEKGGTEWRYLSPFRNEAEPSFYVNTKKNVWFDHGEGEGSRSVVDFGVKFLQSNGRASSVSDVLDWLKGLGFGGIDTLSLFSDDTSRFVSNVGEAKSDLDFIRAKPVSHPAIFQYLSSRGIPENLVRKYLVEIQYRNLIKDKVFFALGMKNQSDGYEIRSASDKMPFKSALIKRDISFIPGQSKDKITHINVFEGMTDFLSLLVLLNSNALGGDALIMHSLSSYSQSLDFINNNQYKTANLWLDNDTSGIKIAQKFKSEACAEVLDQSDRYSKHKDLNRALQASIDEPGSFFLSLV